MRYWTKSTKGFTLIEIMLVIVILGLLAGVAAFSLLPREGKAKRDLTKIGIGVVMMKLHEYNMDMKAFPTEQDGGLNALVTKPEQDDESPGEWVGPYLAKDQLKDKWGRDLHYKYEEATGDEARKPPQVWSDGANKTDDNGDGDDIKSWSDDDES